jgi:signal transduction histidine kinase
VSRDTVAVLAIAVAWSAAVGLAGGLVAGRLRHRSMRWSAVLVAAVAVGGLAAGVLGTAQAMFLSTHDLRVVVLVCLASGAVTLGFALWLGKRVVAGAESLRDAAQRFGETGELAAVRPGPLELDVVADALTRSSARLTEAAERERLLEQSRRDLVAWVSHDLRTPLAQIRAMAEALEDGIAEDQQRYHTQIRIQVDRVAGMVDDLFELSRIHAGNLRLNPQTVELGDLVSEALVGTGAYARSRGVRLDGAVEPGVLVHTDPAAFSRVMVNLVVNAVRHTPADCVVSIRGRATPEGIELAVDDACGGIPDQDLACVFDVGWRGSHARTADPAEGAGPGSGAGLGLAIVRGLVEAQRGSVVVTNAGPGCRFVVSLPA